MVAQFPGPYETAQGVTHTTSEIFGSGGYVLQIAAARARNKAAAAARARPGLDLSSAVDSSSGFIQSSVPTVAVSDYVKMVSEQVGPYVSGPYYCLGTDGFGRSDTREDLRSFFEVDRYYIVLTAIKALVHDGILEKTTIESALKKYKLDPEKPNPVLV